MKYLEIMYTDCFQRIVNEEGFSALWSSLGPSLLLVTNPAIQFMSYEAVKRYFRRNSGTKEVIISLYLYILYNNGNVDFRSFYLII